MAEERFFELYDKPAPWENFGVTGQDFVRYLTKAKEEKRLNELNEKEKRCLRRLEEYLQKTGKSTSDAQNQAGEEDEEESKKDEVSTQFEADKVDLTRITSYYDIAYYLCFPPSWMSEVNKNTQSFVYAELKKGKAPWQIAKEARQKIEQAQKDADPKSRKKKKSKGEDEPQENQEQNPDDFIGPRTQEQEDEERFKAVRKHIVQNELDGMTKPQEQRVEDSERNGLEVGQSKPNDAEREDENLNLDDKLKDDMEEATRE